MAFGKKNKVSTDILKYNLALFGEKGIGKTTLAYNVMKKLCKDDDGYIFLECGKEDGQKAIDGINYVSCPSWETEEDEENGYDENGYNEFTNSAGFINVINDIIDNKTTEYANLKCVVIDTFDTLIDIAEPEVVQMYNKEIRSDPKKQKVTSINSAYGGFNRGKQKALEIIMDNLWRLHSVGVAFFLIGHVKTKDKIDVFTGESYSMLTGDAERTYLDGVMNKLDVVGIAYIDRAIEKEKTGKKDFSGKDVVKGVVKNESRKIAFRPDAYVAETKSRFASITPVIDLDADQFIDAIKNAIEESISGDVSKRKKEDAEKEKKASEIVKKREDNKKQNDTLEDLKKQIVKYITDNKFDAAKTSKFVKYLKEEGIGNPLNITDMETAEKAIKFIKAE